MEWEQIQQIRAAQREAERKRIEAEVITRENAQKILESETFQQLNVPRLNEFESMLFKMRSELITWIVAKGLVQGFIWDGNIQELIDGKINITEQMVVDLVRKGGMPTIDDVMDVVTRYLNENDYVADSNYVHTDNNYTDADVQKLAGIQDGAEVNKVDDVKFNGNSVLNIATKIAEIEITPEEIKEWYESNTDTNVFTDAFKSKLEGISPGAEVNRVDDVIYNGRSTLNENKQAIITAEMVKAAYESNPDTNAFTDHEKEDLASLVAWKPEVDHQIIDLQKQDVELAKQIQATALYLQGLIKQNTDAIAHEHEYANEINQDLQEHKTWDESEHARLESLITNNETELNGLTVRVSDLETSQNAQDLLISSLRADVDKNTADIKINTDDIKQIDLKNTRQDTEIENLHNLINLNASAIRINASAIMVNASAIQRQQLEIDKINDVIDGDTGSIADLRKQVQKNTDDIFEIDAEQKNQDIAISSLRLDVSEIDAEQKTQNIAISSLRLDVGAVAERVAVLASDVKSNTGRIEELEAEDGAIMADITDIKQAIEDLDTSQAAQNVTISSLRVDVNTNQSEIEKINQALENGVPAEWPVIWDNPDIKVNFQGGTYDLVNGDAENLNKWVAIRWGLFSTNHTFQTTTILQLGGYSLAQLINNGEGIARRAIMRLSDNGNKITFDSGTREVLAKGTAHVDNSCMIPISVHRIVSNVGGTAGGGELGEWPKSLWKNNSPFSGMATNTKIPLSDSNFDWIDVVYKLVSNGDSVDSSLIMDGYTTRLVSFRTNSLGQIDQILSRAVMINSSKTELTADNGFYENLSDLVKYDDDSICVPYEIIGHKFGETGGSAQPVDDTPKWNVLWENVNHQDQIETLTIDIPELKNYDYVNIMIKQSTGAGYYFNQISRVGSNSLLNVVGINSGKMDIFTRPFGYNADKTAITFEGAKEGNQTVNNALVIPYRILGIAKAQ